MLVLVHLALAQDKVVGGTQVSLGDWPDAAAVYFGNSVGCTGVLVHEKVVLTAGHCAGGITAVKLATNDYTTTGEKISVSRTIEYTNSWSTYDIAVLVLAEAAETEPRLIASGCALDDLYDGAPAQIVGYGATDIWGTQYGTKLREAPTVIEDSECTDLWSGCNGSVSPGGELGAGGNGTDACYGDSGGPLYLLTDHGDYVVGLTSRSYNAVYAPCEDGGIWVRPDAVIDWIESSAGVVLPRPTCDEDEGKPGDGGDGGDGGGCFDSEDNDAPQPSFDPIVVVQGGTWAGALAANDPDPEDGHIWLIVEEPEHGTAEIGEGGVLAFRADEDYVGDDALLVQVMDDGTPPQTAEAWVLVQVEPREETVAEGGGCAVVPSAGWLALWGAIVPLRRRRSG